ncbi:MAG: molybdopterin-guanine dinucleotide biosynthesis protein B [Chloroflexi bacterium]|nr:molybdopterin-guanine dinucleotide biosynthesis protein B [Chloroflexota bacterium]
MIPLVCIVGKSGTGKTTFMEKLIPEFKSRGYRVAVVKHSKDEGVFDRPGKDSWRLVQAGSDRVLLFSPGRAFSSTRLKKDLSLDEVLAHVGGDYDILLVEGFHRDIAPKIEVHRREIGQELISTRQGLLGVVTDESLDVKVPQFAWDDVKGVADLIERKLVSNRGDLDIGLFVNGLPVEAGDFVQEIMAKTVQGMVSSLKGVDRIDSLDMWIRRRQNTPSEGHQTHLDREA